MKSIDFLDRQTWFLFCFTFFYLSQGARAAMRFFFRNNLNRLRVVWKPLCVIAAAFLLFRFLAVVLFKYGCPKLSWKFNRKFLLLLLKRNVFFFALLSKLRFFGGFCFIQSSFALNQVEKKKYWKTLTTFGSDLDELKRVDRISALRVFGFWTKPWKRYFPFAFIVVVLINFLLCLN